MLLPARWLAKVSIGGGRAPARQFNLFGWVKDKRRGG